jgi:hypothetical protein
VINRQPRISVLFECKAFKISAMVSFVIDSGASYSALSEKEATIMGVDCYSLPFTKQEAVGFGGTFRNRMINRKVTLIFGTNDKEYKIPCGCFEVVMVPPTFQGEQREKMFRYAPNILGMDVLRRFKTIIIKDKVELIPLKEE